MRSLRIDLVRSAAAGVLPLAAILAALLSPRAHAGCPELNRLPANSPDAQISCSGGAVPYGARAADDFLLPAGNGNVYSVRMIKAVLVANFALTPANVGVTIYNDSFGGAPARPVPGSVAIAALNSPATVRDLGLFGGAATDGRPLRLYEIAYAIPSGFVQLAPNRWYWLAPFAVGTTPSAGHLDVAYAMLHGQTGIVGETVNQSHGSPGAPNVFTSWDLLTTCCIAGTWDLAIYVDAVQTGGFFTDFTCDGIVGVSDIFAFLSSWFAGLPEADFDGAGGIGVSDIFEYLSAWFAGV